MCRRCPAGHTVGRGAACHGVSRSVKLSDWKVWWCYETSGIDSESRTESICATRCVMQRVTICHATFGCNDALQTQASYLYFFSLIRKLPSHYVVADCHLPDHFLVYTSSQTPPSFAGSLYAAAVTHLLEVRLLSGYCQVIVRLLSGYCQTIVRLLSGYCQATVRQL